VNIRLKSFAKGYPSRRLFDSDDTLYASKDGPDLDVQCAAVHTRTAIARIKANNPSRRQPSPIRYGGQMPFPGVGQRLTDRRKVCTTFHASAGVGPFRNIVEQRVSPIFREPVAGHPGSMTGTRSMLAGILPALKPSPPCSIVLSIRDLAVAAGAQRRAVISAALVLVLPAINRAKYLHMPLQ